jgi:type VI secretion system protein ImpG
VVNLFPLLAEPIALTHERPDYRVVPDVRRPDACEVFSIDRVSSAGSFLEEPATYEPFYAVRHATRGDGGVPYWFATRRPSPRAGDRGTEVFLTFVDREFRPSRPASRTVSVETTCTNRDLPALLPFGGEANDFALDAAAAVGRVRCLRKPSRSLRPPLGRGDHWRLISHLTLNHLSLADDAAGVEALREVLRLYDFADTAVTRQQIDGLVGVRSRPVAGRTGRGIGNAVCLGREVELTFDETHFAGAGAFLFACVLERFLGLYVSINSFVRLVARSAQREGVLHRWPPRSGETTLL